MNEVESTNSPPKENHYRTRVILGIIIIVSVVLSIFLGPQYKTGLYILIISVFALLALSMNYSWEGKDRNAWDVWFFAMPGVIVALFLVGILGEENYPEIWKWVAIALGGAAGLESLSSIIKALRDKKVS